MSAVYEDCGEKGNFLGRRVVPNNPKRKRDTDCSWRITKKIGRGYAQKSSRTEGSNRASLLKREKPVRIRRTKEGVMGFHTGQHLIRLKRPPPFQEIMLREKE